LTSDIRHSRLLSRADVPAIVDLYAEDAILLPPDVPAVTGRDGIQAYWMAAAAGGLSAATQRTQRVEGDGDLVVVVGIAESTVSGGTAMQQYVSVWRRHTNGQLYLVIDTWNARSS
jgi:ketosteroid isomerase-like protein